MGGGFLKELKVVKRAFPLRGVGRGESALKSKTQKRSGRLGTMLERVESNGPTKLFSEQIIEKRTTVFVRWGEGRERRSQG